MKLREFCALEVLRFRAFEKYGFERRAAKREYRKLEALEALWRTKLPTAAPIDMKLYLSRARDIYDSVWQATEERLQRFQVDDDGNWSWRALEEPWAFDVLSEDEEEEKKQDEVEEEEEQDDEEEEDEEEEEEEDEEEDEQEEEEEDDDMEVLEEEERKESEEEEDDDL